jgi:hypothetical protein
MSEEQVLASLCVCFRELVGSVSQFLFIYLHILWHICEETGRRVKSSHTRESAAQRVLYGINVLALSALSCVFIFMHALVVCVWCYGSDKAFAYKYFIESNAVFVGRARAAQRDEKHTQSRNMCLFSPYHTSLCARVT